MTDIHKLPAGPELDALVAVNVMGWKSPRSGAGRRGTWVDKTGNYVAEAECGTEYGDDEGPCPGDCDDECLRFRPSTSASDANKVLKALKKIGVTLTVEDPEPYSICRAALKAVSL